MKTFPARTLVRDLTRPALVLCVLLCAFLLSACSPKYDWREIHVTHAPYMIAFPAKPTHETRTVQLAGQNIAMTMSSARIDGITFAVSSASIPDPANAQAALAALKAALVTNTQGQIKQQSPLKLKQAQGEQIEIAGSQNRQGRTRAIALNARFISKGAYIYQLVVTGPKEQIVPDTIDTFFTSFVSRE